MEQMCFFSVFLCLSISQIFVIIVAMSLQNYSIHINDWKRSRKIRIFSQGPFGDKMREGVIYNVIP